MRSLSFRVVASLATIVLGGFHAGRAQAQVTTSLQVLTPQGPVEIDSKWSAEDDSRQRARFAMQSRTRLRTPVAPSQLTAADNGQEGVSLSWPDVANESSYVLERAPAFTSPVSVQANTIAYNDPSGPGLYHYRIKATNLAGASEISDWVPVLVGVSLPAAPSGLAASTPGNGTALLSWTDNSHNEVRFEIQRSPSFSVGVSVGSNITNFIDMPGPGTAYYRVRAVNSAGASDFSPWVQAGVTAPVPASPTNLAAVDLGNGSARVTWSDNSNNETSFQVERQPSSGGPVSISANATTFDDPCGAGSFSYRIRAVNSAGASSYTPWEAVNVATSSAPTPTNVNATDVGNRRAMVSWTDNATTETGFEVQRNPAFTTGTVQVGANVTAYVDPCGAGTFAYRVRSRSAAGASAYSTWANVSIANTPPAAPSAVTLEDMGNQTNVRVGWTDNADNETGFMIQRQEQVSGVWGGTVNKTTGANATTYMDNPGTGKFRYRMCATNSVGSSTWTVWLVVDVGTGWTVFTPSGDSRIVYVSSSGSDSNTGLSEAAPKRTIAAGYALLRHGYPDWLLLKRGDMWTEAFPQWRKSGRSASEKMVVGSYGTALVRPLLRTGESSGFSKSPSSSTPRVDNIALVGIHMHAHERHAGSGGAQGVSWIGGGSNVLIEDCYIEGYSTNIVFDAYDSQIDDVAVRRCVIVDSFSGTTHSQGMYAYKAIGLLVEECVFDHNGWKEGVTEPTIFNHNAYITNGTTNLVFRRNIVMDAASHGLQARPGGEVEDNLLVRNAVSLLFGGGDEPTPGGVTGSIIRNVILEGKDISPSARRGYGIDLKNIASATIEENLIANKLTSAEGFCIGSWVSGGPVGAGLQNLTIRNNVMYNWPGPVSFYNPAPASYSGNVFEDNQVLLGSGALVDMYSTGPSQVAFSHNRYHSSSSANAWFAVGSNSMSLSGWIAASGEVAPVSGAVAFPDPSRSVATYAGTQGAPATFEGFRAEVRKSSRFNWRPEWTAGEINKYFRAGFGIQE